MSMRLRMIRYSSQQSLYLNMNRVYWQTCARHVCILRHPVWCVHNVQCTYVYINIGFVQFVDSYRLNAHLFVNWQHGLGYGRRVNCRGQFQDVLPLNYFVIDLLGKRTAHPKSIRSKLYENSIFSFTFHYSLPLPCGTTCRRATTVKP